MTSLELESLKADFLAWSGGFEPDGDFEIEVYVLYARSSAVNEDECRDALRTWLKPAMKE